MSLAPQQEEKQSLDTSGPRIAEHRIVDVNSGERSRELRWLARYARCFSFLPFERKAAPRAHDDNTFRGEGHERFGHFFRTALLHARRQKWEGIAVFFSLGATKFGMSSFVILRVETSAFLQILSLSSVVSCCFRANSPGR